jgi:zinc transporter ZupT
MRTPSRTSVVVLAALPAATGVASAHGGTAGTGVPLVVVALASALVGVASGVTAVYWRPRLVSETLSRHRFTLALAVGLTLLGLAFFVPVVTRQPLVAVAGLGVGAAAVRTVPHQHATDGSGSNPLVGSVVLALALHRAFEGVVLASGFLAGETVGAMTVAVVTVHAAGETAVVGGLVALAGHTRRAVLAVLAMQGLFVLAAVTSVGLSLTLPAATHAVVLAVVAGVLLSVGGHECRQCYVEFRAPA